MVKYLLIGAGVVVLAMVVLLALLLRNGGHLPATTGTLGDLERYLEALEKAQSPHAFLIATIEDTEDFIQFKHHDGTYEIDFPIFTERQRSLETRIKQVGAGLHLAARITEVEDGNRFVDFDFRGSAPDAAAVSRSLFQGVFETDPGVTIKFQCAEFEPPAS